MKTLELSEKKNPSLAESLHALGDDPVAVLENGRPIAVLLPVGDDDLETIALSLSPEFHAILRRSAERRAKEGGVSEEEVRRLFGIKDPANGKTHAAHSSTKRKRSASPKSSDES